VYEDGSFVEVLHWRQRPPPKHRIGNNRYATLELKQAIAAKASRHWAPRTMHGVPDRGATSHREPSSGSEE
jgi:hypothetical protein